MSIRCTWVAPAKHKSGRPAAAGMLVGYDLQMKVEGAPSFTSIAQPGANETEFTIDVTDPGLYEFRLFARAANETISDAGTGSIVIPDTSPLEAPALTVALV